MTQQAFLLLPPQTKKAPNSNPTCAPSFALLEHTDPKINASPFASKIEGYCVTSH